MDVYKILITGSRTWAERPTDYFSLYDVVRAAVDARVARETEVITVAIRECVLANAGKGVGIQLAHGGARGADSCGAMIGEQLRLDVKQYRADWNQYGRAAGMRRNVEMLDDFKPDVVLAFSANLRESRGTSNCVRAAMKRKIPVYLYNGKARPRRLTETSLSLCA